MDDLVHAPVVDPAELAPEPTEMRRPRSCSPQGRPARQRACATCTVNSPRNVTRSRQRTAITGADRLVAAFAPFALYGPALGIPTALPACDVTKPGELTAAVLDAACERIGATLAFASPAALANVVATACSG